MVNPILKKVVIDPILIVAEYKLVKGVAGKFLGPRKMGILKSVFTFGFGFYCGAFAAQNYQLPKMDEPQELWRKFQDYIDQYKKDKWNHVRFCN